MDFFRIEIEILRMAKPLLDERLWSHLEPVIPVIRRRYRYSGRKRVTNRATLTGILFVLKTGIPWEDLPQEMGCGCGMTCWRRYQEWQRSGVWDRILSVLLPHLRKTGEVAFSQALLDVGVFRADRRNPKRNQSFQTEVEEIQRIG